MPKLRCAQSQRLNERFYKFCLTENHPFVVDLAGCHGAYLRTVEGQDIFDWAGYYGSKLIGHNHPGLAAPDYVNRLVCAANNKVPNPDFLTRECLSFYRLAHTMAPVSMKRSQGLEVYAVNSGAEVVENMLKYLISMHNSRVGASASLRQRRFMVFKNSFHGRTVFALSLTTTQSRVATKDFHPLFESNITMDFPAGIFSGFAPARLRAYNEEVTDKALATIAKALKKHAGSVVGIVIEPIQGAGGHNVAPKRFFEALSSLAATHDVQLGFDEVQTGMGGTGKRFYVDHLKLARPPQAVVVAKKFGVGVLYMLEHLRDMGVLDSTWGGPLVDMVRAQREIQIVRQEKLIPRVAKLGRVLQKGLRALEAKYPDVLFNVRGLGFLQGFSVLPTHEGRARQLLLDIALKKHLLLMLKAGRSTIRLRPNLSTTVGDVGRFLGLLEDAIQDFRKARPRSWQKRALKQRQGDLHALMGGLG